MSGLPPSAPQNTVDFGGVVKTSLVFADVDGDGDQDVLMSDWNTTKLHTNDGSGNYTEVVGTPFDGPYGSIAIGDADGDGDQDVLIVSSGPYPTTAKLYSNDGSGNFTEVAGTPFLGAYNSKVNFVDVDGDNDQDVVIVGDNNASSPTSATAKLYTNDGSGNFTEVVGEPFQALSQGTVDFADVDGDNDQDVLISGMDSSFQPVTSLYKNDGSGVFTDVGSGIPSSPFWGLRYSSAAFADVDGDNDLDILITGVTGPSDPISMLFINDGTGLFGQVTDAFAIPFIGVRDGTVAFADVDGDNDQDVLIIGNSEDWNNNAPIAKLYINDNFQTWASQWGASITNGGFIEVVGTPFIGVTGCLTSFADVDGDTDQDVIVAGWGSQFNITNLYVNDGLGLFAEVRESVFDGVVSGSVTFADIDGDTDSDVLITGLGPISETIVKLYSNDGSGAYTEVSGTPFTSVFRSSVDFADVDGDNDQDLLITGQGIPFDNASRITKLYTNDGSGGFTEVIGTPFPGVADGSVAFADIDGDNDQDVLITGEDATTFHVARLYTNDGSGGFTEVIGTPFTEVANSSIAFADVDGDNDQDVLITGYNISNVRVAILYTNDGSGNFTEVVGTPFGGYSFASVAFADVDNDNDQDVLIGGQAVDGFSSIPIAKLYTNDGAGNFTEVVGFPFIQVVQGSVAFADVDGDSDQDALIAGLANSRLYSNNGSGVFTEVSGLPFDGVSYCSIAFADVDGDAAPDVLISGLNDQSNKRIAKLYRNISTAGCDDGDGDGICDDVDSCPTLFGEVGDPCDDGIVCTENDFITAACECQGTPNDNLCDDGDPCTVDSCDPVLGCQNINFCQPPNNECGDAIDVSLATFPGQSNELGTFSGATSSGPSSCDPQVDSFFDVFYEVTLTETNRLAVEVFSIGGFAPVVEIYDGCQGTLVACAASAGPDEVAVLTPELSAGTYLIRVGVHAAAQPDAGNGSFLLSVQDLPFAKVQDNPANPLYACNQGGFQLEDFVGASPQSTPWILDYQWRVAEVGGGSSTDWQRGEPNYVSRCSWLGMDYDKTYNVFVRLLINHPEFGPTWGVYRGDFANPNDVGASSCTISTAVNVTPTEIRPQYTPTNAQGDDYALCDLVVAYNIANAQNFRWSFDGNGSFGDGEDIVYTRGSGNPSVQLSLVGGLVPGNTYNVGVEVQVSGLWSGYSTILPISLALPSNTVQLRTQWCDGPATSYVMSESVCAADNYTFEFDNGSTVSTFTSTNYVCFLNNLSPAVSTGNYNVRVKVSQGGVPGDFGPVCVVTVPGAPPTEGITAQRELGGTTATLFPNPNAGSEVRVNLDGLSAGNHEVMISVYDIYGKQVSAQGFGHEGTTLSRLVRFDQGLAMGMYMLYVVVDGEPVATERLVVN